MQHGNTKVMADELVNDIKVELDRIRAKAMSLSRMYIFNHSEKDKHEWKKAQLSELSTFRADLRALLLNTNKTINKQIKTAFNGIIPSNKLKQINAFVDKSINQLYKSVDNSHKQMINLVNNYEIRSVQDTLLADSIQHVFDTRPNGNYINVTYQNGKTYRWENYIEMNVRTTLQNEIAQELVNAGANIGVVFYMPSFYGDCALDHAEYQNKIYYDERYESFIKDDNLKDLISDYIGSHNLMSIQEAMNDEPYLTTRPNCRHYFNYLTLDDVIDVNTGKAKINNSKDLHKVQDDFGVAFNGTYQADKYRALQEQRYNERSIRAWKETKDNASIYLNSLNPNDPNYAMAKKQLQFATSKVSQWQQRQRDLVDNGIDGKGNQINNTSLVRTYKRETFGKRSNGLLGVKK